MFLYATGICCYYVDPLKAFYFNLSYLFFVAELSSNICTSTSQLLMYSVFDGAYAPSKAVRYDSVTQQTPSGRKVNHYYWITLVYNVPLNVLVMRCKISRVLMIALEVGVFGPSFRFVLIHI